MYSKKKVLRNKLYQCGNKTLKSKKQDIKYIGKHKLLDLLGEGGYASVCDINNEKILRVINKDKICGTNCLKDEFYNVKLLEDFNKKTNNKYTPNIYSNYINCNLKVCINPTFTYSIQEKYDYDLSDYLRYMEIGIIDKYIAYQIIEIINILHRKKIFHRDIKTENFLVKEVLQNKNKFLKIAITDFGLSTYIKKGKLKTMKLRFVPWVQPPFLKNKYNKINKLPEKEKIKFLTYLDWWATIMILLNITNTDSNKNIFLSINFISSSENNTNSQIENIIEFYNQLNYSLKNIKHKLIYVDIIKHISKILKSFEK